MKPALRLRRNYSTARRTPAHKQVFSTSLGSPPAACHFRTLKPRLSRASDSTAWLPQLFRGTGAHRILRVKKCQEEREWKSNSWEWGGGIFRGGGTGTSSTELANLALPWMIAILWFAKTLSVPESPSAHARQFPSPVLLVKCEATPAEIRGLTPRSVFVFDLADFRTAAARFPQKNFPIVLDTHARGEQDHADVSQFGARLPLRGPRAVSLTVKLRVER